MSGRVIASFVALLLLVATPQDAAASDRKGKKHAKHARAGEVTHRDSDARVAVDVRFGAVDIRLIRKHYAPRYRNLPPGLQKKVARGGQLPPGWRKKFEPFPVRLEEQLRPLPRGYRRGVLDGHAVVYDSKSHVIIDVAVLF
jgi:hypothetical protein